MGSPADGKLDPGMSAAARQRLDLRQGRRVRPAAKGASSEEVPLRNASRSIAVHTDRIGTGFIGLILFTSAALSEGLARAHIASRGVICGADRIPHCGWCYGAAGLALAGLAAFALAFAPARGFGKTGLLQIKAR
jgi:hypothetical protein